LVPRLAVAFPPAGADVRNDAKEARRAMKFLKWFNRAERRSVNTSQWDRILTELQTTAAGVTVTAETALQVPAVFACVQVLAQDVARTPIKFREQIEADTYEDARDHDLFEILGSLPNPEQTAYQFKHAMQWNLLAHSRAYAEIVRVGGRITALWPLDPDRMHVDRDDQRRKRWRYTAADGRQHVWTFDPSMPPIFELTHETPICRCRDLIGTALALQTYVGSFFANGARVGGVLKAAHDLDDEQAKELKEVWKGMFQGARNAHRIAVLQGGLEYQPIASENDEAQLNETVHAITQAICGAFRVPTWKVGDLSKATYSNMSAGEIAYVTSTLDPYFQAWEDAIRRDLLTNRQFNRFSAQFDRNALIRSDVQAQHTALETGINAGFYSQNDARRALGMNPIDGGDVYRISAPAPKGEPNVA
jgi:HK97 family phage portal protein